MRSARPGRQFSLFTVLGGSLLIGFLIIMTSVLWLQYQLSREVIHNETKQSLSHNHALFRSVVYGHLTLVKDQLRTLAHSMAQNNRHWSVDDPENIRQQFKAISTRAATDADFILMTDLSGSVCIKLSGRLPQLEKHCTEAISLANSGLQDWHLGLLKLESPKIAVISSTPLLGEYGQVLAYIYAGVLLSDNINLINQAMSLSAATTQGIAISFERQIIVSSAPADSDHYYSLEQAALQPNQPFQQDDGHVALSQILNIDHSSAIKVHLVSLIKTDGLQKLQQGLLRQSSATLALAILLSILLGLLALHLSLTPLKRLHRWASQRVWLDTSGNFNPGIISEFRALGQELAEIVSTLKKTEIELQQKADLLELSHREQRQLTERNRSLLHQFYSLQEQERKHLAQELHDELGQPLAIINTDAYLIKKYNDPSSRSYSYAESIQQSTQLMSNVVYHRITSLRPMPLNDLGLAEAIRHMPAMDLLHNKGVRLKLALPSKLPPLDEQLAIQLYRIAQESLTNIIKHSQASEVEVELSATETRLELSITDNGIGFNPSLSIGGNSHGVNGMIERAKSIAANITIAPNRNRGTRVRVVLDLTHQNPNSLNASISNTEGL